jgi:hypothetical protein
MIYYMYQIEGCGTPKSKEIDMITFLKSWAHEHPATARVGVPAAILFSAIGSVGGVIISLAVIASMVLYHTSLRD